MSALMRKPGVAPSARRTHKWTTAAAEIWLQALENYRSVIPVVVVGLVIGASSGRQGIGGGFIWPT